MICVYCGSNNVHRHKYVGDYCVFKCLKCSKYFKVEGIEKNEYIYKFNVKVRKSDSNKITRENYRKKTNKICYEHKKNIDFYIKYCNITIPGDVFLDRETYTDKYVEEQYNDCMYNYDLNMKYFSKLDREEFSKYIKGFTKKYRFIEVVDLNELKEKRGVYILVLDEFKQAYMGISNDAKKRIMQHWSKKKEFDRLLHGDKDHSILSIDSFGILDTTRIYFKEISFSQDINKIEEKIINKFDCKYLLNRVGGGLNSPDKAYSRGIELFGTMKKRTLNDN